MLPEQKDLIYKYFPRLVQECDLESVLEYMVKKGGISIDALDEVSPEEDTFHKNRRILFQLLKCETANVFPALVEGLRHNNYISLADVLENKLQIIIQGPSIHPLDIAVSVRFSTQFYDTAEHNKTAFYTTRSKNRGHVLMINNIKFSEEQDERHGAHADEQNLKELFMKMGLSVFSFTDLAAKEIHDEAQKFAQYKPEDKPPPDIGIVVIMSHGIVVNNETVVLGTDNKYVVEDHVTDLFNNENCPLFRKKPKIFIFHFCRTVLKKPVNEGTMTDAILRQVQRTYSDMLICHPSMKGFGAHRNTVKGSWYIQLLCKVFMEFAYDMDVESLLRKVDEELEVMSSLPWVLKDTTQGTQQTSTFQNIAFKKCYLHPGLYEEDGQPKQLEETT